MAESLTVNCSPTAKSLPIRAGLRNGTFLARDIALRLVATENSREQRAGLARGDFEIVHVAIDNAVAMKDIDGIDVVVVLGGDSGMNELFVQQHIDSIGDIRGGRLVVDAPDTAFALQAYRILADHDMAWGRDYEVATVGRGELRIAAMLADPGNTASILNLPYSLEARRAGLRSLGDTTQFIGPYQAGSAFALRRWAESHRDLLVRYIAAYLEALAWVLDINNHAACMDILTGELRADADIADETLHLLRKPGFGLEPRAAIDWEGFRNALALRAGLSGTRPAAEPERYVDLSYYRAALALDQARVQKARV